jgi:pimeloyl-ACP methyl ester carboxylesterase/DNA-binding CsgD family transcriptional regulator
MSVVRKMPLEMLSKLHQDTVSEGSVEKYSEFMDSFRDITATFSEENISPISALDQMEDFSEEVILKFLNNDIKLELSEDEGVTEHGNGYCSLIVNASGKIIEANPAALSIYDFKIGITLEDNGIECFGGLGFKTQLADVLRSENEDQDFKILQVSINESSALSTLAVKPFKNQKYGGQCFLIIFLTQPNTYNAVKLIATKFELTEAETQISIALIAGQSLKEIAAQRERSYKTIRNQFQQILDKTNCNSQHMYIRLVNDLTFLLLKEEKVAEETAAKPLIAEDLIRIVEIPRPNGRIVEVLTCGDEHGTPLMCFPALFGHGITTEIAQSFIEKKVYFISVARPGYGRTSKALDGQSYTDCLVKDIKAIFASLEIEPCVLAGRASAAPSVYNILATIPQYFKGGLVIGGVVPRKYFNNKSVKSKWTESVMAVQTFSKPISRLLLATGHRLLLKSDPVAFLEKMYRHSATDSAAFKKGNTAELIRQSCIDATVQGIDAGVQDMVESFEEWDAILSDIQLPVNICHGTFDANVPFKAVEEFHTNRKANYTLTEFVGGGGQLFYSHTDELIDQFYKIDRSSNVVSLP